MGFEVIANIYPAAGKEGNVRDGLQRLAKYVRDNEPDCSRYQVYEQTNAEGKPAQFVVVEEYKDKAAFDHHLSTQFFKDIGAEIEKGGWMAAPLDIKTVNKLQDGGFLAR